MEMGIEDVVVPSGRLCIRVGRPLNLSDAIVPTFGLEWAVTIEMSSHVVRRVLIELRDAT